jgi:hypothetical protein
VRFDPERFGGIVRNIRDFKIPEPGDPPFFVHFEMTGEPLALGTLVTVFRNGDEAIGRGIVGGDGTVDIIPDVPFNKGDKLSLSLQQDKALPAQEDIENPKGGEPTPPQKTNTTLNSTCADSPHDDADPMTTTGTLNPAFAGAAIKLTYTRPNNGGTFVRNVQTDANGAWSDTITPAQESGQTPAAGPWTIHADFEGDSSHNPSAAECTVNVVNNF